MTDRIDNPRRVRLYGKPCTPANHRIYTTPWGIRVQVHNHVASRFAAGCVVAHRESRWVPKRIDSYNCRTIRGSRDAYSTHAWALSWDFFATPPNVEPPGGVWTPDDPPDAKFIAAFTELGFVWGGTFERKDTPHFEWATAPPGTEPVLTPNQEASMAKVPNVAGFCVTGEDNLIVTTTDGAIWAFNPQGGTANGGWINAYNANKSLHDTELPAEERRRCIGVYTIDTNGKPSQGGTAYCQVFDDGARYKWLRP